MIVSYPTIYCTEHTGHWLARIENIFSFNRSLCALLSHCVLHCIPQTGHFNKGECTNAHFNMIQRQGRTMLCALLRSQCIFLFPLCIVQCVVQCYVHCSRVKGGLLGQIRLCMEVGHWVSDLPGL